MATALIDVGDGTLIAPPPATPYVAPAPPPPAVSPTPPPPSTAPTAPTIITQPGSAYIDVGDGTVILAPNVTQPAPAPPTSSGAPDYRPIVQPGQAYIDVGDGTVILAPPSTGSDSGATAGTEPASGDYGGDTIGIAQPATENDAGSDQGVFDADFELEDLDGLRFLSASDSLRGRAFIDYVRSGAEGRGLDALAVLANAYNEGLGGGIGDHGTSYGPWQLHDGGGLPRKYWGRKRNDPAIQAWAWSKSGVSYALDSMAKTSAKGKFGALAVHELVYEFERPADKPGQYIVRLRTYEQLSRLGAGAWTFLAQYAHGPSGTAAAPPTSAPTTKPKQNGVAASWRGFLNVMGVDLPTAGVDMQGIARRLERAVS